jgi:tetratricopeptide (TPR) repeat protein
MPRPAKRVKINRKDIRQPDEFESLATQSALWAREHQSLLAACVGVVVVIGVLGLLVARSRAARTEAAAIDFRVAHTLFEARKFHEAADAFAALGQSAGGTTFGRLAGLYRGHALARQGDTAGAATAYTEYLATSPEASYLRQEALVGLGRAKETSGDAAGALDAYTQAAAVDGPFKADAMLASARLQEASGQSEAARATYGRLMAEARDPDLRALLAAKLPPAPAEPPPPANVR